MLKLTMTKDRIPMPQRRIDTSNSGSSSNDLKPRRFPSAGQPLYEACMLTAPNRRLLEEGAFVKVNKFIKLLLVEFI